MHARILVLAFAALLLTGCSATPTADDTISPSVAASPTSEPPAPTPSASSQSALLVTAEGLTLTSSAGDSSATFRDAASTLALLTSVFGPPDGETRDEQDAATTYVWDGITLHVWDGGPAFLGATVAEVGGVTIATQGGVSVGSSRSEAIDAGASDTWDADGDGIADYLQLGEVPVDDAESLVHPGNPGSIFVELEMDGDAVIGIRAPGNDFSDI